MHEGEGGPKYPSLPRLAKYRRIKNPTPAQRRAHGDAVHAAIRALQLRELFAGQRAVPDSGPYKYVWRANLARLVKLDRTPQQWRDLYNAAMRSKREREVGCSYKEAA